MHQYLHHESHDWSDQDDIDRLNLFRIAALTMIFGKDLDVDGELKCSRYLTVQEIRVWFPDISEVDEEEIHNEGNREEQEEEDEEEEFDRFLYEEIPMQRGAQDVLGEHTSQSERIRMSRNQHLTDAMLLEESFRRLGTYEDYGSSLLGNSLDTSSANIPPLNSSSPRASSVRSSYSRTRRANTRTKNTFPQNDLTPNAVQDFGSWENYEVLNAPSLSNDRSPITSSSDAPPRNFNSFTAARLADSFGDI